MRRSQVLLVALFLGSCVSCSSRDLSRPRAAELIASQQHLPTTQTITIYRRYLKRSWSNPVVGFGKITLCNYQGEQYADVESRLGDYWSVGLITTEEVTENGDCPSTWETVTLTDQGRKYLAAESAGAFEVKVFDLACGEVTGIQTNESSKTAKADYTLKLINVTPFGNNISPAQDSRIATFAQFDDGWRIEPAPVRAAAIRFRPIPLPSPGSSAGSGQVEARFAGVWLGNSKLTIIVSGTSISSPFDSTDFPVLSGKLIDDRTLYLRAHSPNGDFGYDLRLSEDGSSLRGDWRGVGGTTYAVSFNRAVAKTPCCSVGIAVSSVVGRYNRTDMSNGQYLELKADGTLRLHQEWGDSGGSFVLNGGTVTLKYEGGAVQEGCLSGNAIVGTDGYVWKR